MSTRIEARAEISHEEIGKKLNTARSSAGLSQAQAAGLMGMHRPTVSEIEAGRRRVSAEELARFADIYGVEVNWLLNRPYKSLLSPASIRVAARGVKGLSDDQIERLIELMASVRNPRRSSED